jgi:hypothetical protein
MEKSVNKEAHKQFFELGGIELKHHMTAQSVGIGLADKLFDDFKAESLEENDSVILEKGLSIASDHAASILCLGCYELPKDRLKYFEKIAEDACKLEWKMRTEQASILDKIIID